MVCALGRQAGASSFLRKKCLVSSQKQNNKQRAEFLPLQEVTEQTEVLELGTPAY